MKIEHCPIRYKKKIHYQTALSDAPETVTGLGTDFWYVCHWHYIHDTCTRIGAKNSHPGAVPGAQGATPNEISAPSCGPKKVRLYPGIAPGWVYYFRPTIAAFAITGTNPYS